MKKECKQFGLEPPSKEKYFYVPWIWLNKKCNHWLSPIRGACPVQSWYIENNG